MTRRPLWLLSSAIAGCLLLGGNALAQQSNAQPTDHPVQKIKKAKGHDRDNNPPGPIGGQGTNWENPPGPKGGAGVSPDRHPWRDRDNNPPGPLGGPGSNWENPPGPKGGPGTSPDRFFRHSGFRYRFTALANGFFFNPYFGYVRPGYGFWNQSRRCWQDMDNNPPGPRGGPGTNWENPPGLSGGPGASPDRFGRCR